MGSLFAKRVMPNGEVEISGGTNTDLFFVMALMMQGMENEGRKMARIGQVNKFVPFLHGEHTGSPDPYFDFLLDAPEYDFPLFWVPKPSVGNVDHAIGLYASTLIKDGGTLQIGIGALADGIVNSIIARHANNPDYQLALNEFGVMDKFGETIHKFGGTKEFVDGLHVNSEMLVEPFLALVEAGIVKRKVYDHAGIQRLVNEGKIKNDQVPENIIQLLLDIKAIPPVIVKDDFDALGAVGIFKDGLKFTEQALIDKSGKQFSTDLREKKNLDAMQSGCLGKSLKNGYTMGGAFFLGSRGFYDALLAMPESERELIRMNSVLTINTLYGNEALRRLQRKGARFINTGMYLTLMGGIASDQLEDGRMVSGVGGQFNFVEMAHVLADGRSIMIVKSTKGGGKLARSNIRFNYGHITIPRYLKDIVVTEYGIADLRSKSDAETIAAILNITDSRFQEKLLAEAKAAKKIPADYQIPELFKHNTPEALAVKMAPLKEKGLFKPFPFGSDYTREEIVLGGALKALKNFVAENGKIKVLPKILKSIPKDKLDKAMPFLKRMSLDAPNGKEEAKDQKLVVFGLELVKAV